MDTPIGMQIESVKRLGSKTFWVGIPYNPDVYSIASMLVIGLSFLVEYKVIF